MVAKPDDKWGETPCAFVELKPGQTATGDELVAWCKKNLAGYKVPRHIVFAELPKTSTGKIQKFKLREMAKALRGHARDARLATLLTMRPGIGAAHPGLVRRSRSSALKHGLQDSAIAVVFQRGRRREPAIELLARGLRRPRRAEAAD